MMKAGHKSILFLLLVILISKWSFAQVRDRFPDDQSHFISEFPLISGYSTNSSDTAFHQGVDGFLLKKFNRAFRTIGYSIDGSCQVLLTVKGNQVLEVQIIESNSDVFARMIEGYLFDLPLENNIPGELKITHRVGRMAGCCKNGELNTEPISYSLNANQIIAHVANEHNTYSNDSIRWLIQTQGSKPTCIALNPGADDSWNDLILNHLDTICSGLPDNSGLWMVGYYPAQNIEELQQKWRSSLRNTEGESIDWRRSLNRWLTYYGCNEFHPDRAANDTIYISEWSEIKLDIRADQRVLFVVDPTNREVLSILTVEQHEVVDRKTLGVDISLEEMNSGCHPMAPIIIEVLP